MGGQISLVLRDADPDPPLRAVHRLRVGRSARCDRHRVTQQLLAEASPGPGRADAPTEYERRPVGYKPRSDRALLARRTHAVAEVRYEVHGQPSVRRERET